MPAGGEGVGVDGLAGGEVLGLLVVYPELMESGIDDPPLQPWRATSLRHCMIGKQIESL